jgi:DNA-binding transcriptional LysR family regulator
MNIAGSDLNLLFVFEALLSERNVSRAAAKIGRSQPAVSNALGRLRGLLRDPLFVRAGRAMAPTPRALDLAPEVAAALSHARRALGGAEFAPRESSKAFRLAMTDDVEHRLLPPLLRRLGAAAPNVAIGVRRLPSLFEAPEADLRSGAVDFAVGRFPGPPPVESGLSMRRLYRDPFVCIARRGHPAVRGRLDRARFLAAGHAAVFSPGRGPGMLDQLLSERGEKRRVVVSVPHFLAIPFIVARTDLIATVPGSVAAAFEAPLELRRFPPPIAVPALDVHLVWHARAHEDASHVWFRGLVLDVARSAGRASRPGSRKGRRRADSRIGSAAL